MICQKCGGMLLARADEYGRYWDCLRCGRHIVRDAQNPVEHQKLALMMQEAPGENLESTFMPQVRLLQESYQEGETR